jgi:hypothetical protein
MAWRRNQLKMAKWRHINIINGIWLMALASAKLSAGHGENEASENVIMKKMCQYQYLA